MLRLLLRASKEGNTSEVLKQLAELEALPCNNDTELATIEDAGAQLPCIMRTRYALRAWRFRLRLGSHRLFSACAGLHVACVFSKLVWGPTFLHWHRTVWLAAGRVWKKLGICDKSLRSPLPLWLGPYFLCGLHGKDDVEAAWRARTPRGKPVRLRLPQCRPQLQLLPIDAETGRIASNVL